MPVNKGKIFQERSVFIDYPFEEVMFRWDHEQRQVYRKFYGQAEGTSPVPTDNRLYNDAILYGDEITREQYVAGR